MKVKENLFKNEDYARRNTTAMKATERKLEGENKALFP